MQCIQVFLPGKSHGQGRLVGYSPWGHKDSDKNHLSKNETRTLSNTIRKVNSKWVKDLNIRPETIKLLEENISKIISDINHSRILYDPPPRITEIKAKRKQMGPN